MIFLYNKIIYTKTQIKTKTQNPEREIDKMNKILVFFKNSATVQF